MLETSACTTGPLNQYTAIGRGEEAAFEPVYDADGNQTLIRTSTGIWQVAYNAENRPVRFVNESAKTVVECTYDYMGRRHTRKVSVNGTVSNYLRYMYRGYLQIAAIDAVSGAFRWFLFWDPTQPEATRPLAIRKDGTWYAYGWDLTGNVTEVFGKAGYLRTAYTYTPYGEVTAEGDVTQPIQWSSEYNDEELGLVYYNYRHLNPLDGE
jgi:YD repeat-containing protein